MNEYKPEPNNPNIFPSTEEKENNTPFNVPEKIYNFLKGALINIHDNIPAVITIDGGQGSGKTTLAIELADAINHLTGKTEVNLKEKENVQYGVGAEQFLKKLPESSAQQYLINIYDEGGDYSRKGALSRFNKAMDQAMATVRVYKSIIIIVCHDFSKLPREMFDKQIVTVLIHCKQRSPESGYSTAEVYDYNNLCYVLYNKKQTIVPEYAYKGANFHFRFKDITPTRSKQLTILGATKKKELWEGTQIKMQGFLTYKDLATKIGKSIPTIKRLLRELKIKPETTHKKKNYYNPNILDTLPKRIIKKST